MDWGKVLKKAGNIAMGAAKKTRAQVEEIVEVNNEYQSREDKDLFQIVHSMGFSAEPRRNKDIAIKVLKSRGYTDKQIEDHSL